MELYCKYCKLLNTNGYNNGNGYCEYWHCDCSKNCLSCSKFEAQAFRGKRANVFGTIMDNGILWTDISNGKQTFERYD